VLEARGTKCGSFTFGFYIFDFNRDPNSKYYLDKEDREILKAHRIYLYRDNIRVYPYGDSDDDWLQIDTYRGTVSAGWFLSNDQVVGHVNITQRGNRPPLLLPRPRPLTLTVTSNLIAYCRARTFSRDTRGRSEGDRCLLGLSASR
jgi:hypothetical protein